MSNCDNEKNSREVNASVSAFNCVSFLASCYPEELLSPGFRMNWSGPVESCSGSDRNVHLLIISHSIFFVKKEREKSYFFSRQVQVLALKIVFVLLIYEDRHIVVFPVDPNALAFMLHCVKRDQLKCSKFQMFKIFVVVLFVPQYKQNC